MTEMNVYKKDLAKLRKSKNFDKCYKMVEYLMYKIVDHNALGRGLDRAIEKHITDKDLRAAIYRDAIQEKFNGDEFAQEEHEFFMSLKFINEKD